MKTTPKTKSVPSSEWVSFPPCTRYIRIVTFVPTRSLKVLNDFSSLVYCCCHFGSDVVEQHTHSAQQSGACANWWYSIYKRRRISFSMPLRIYGSNKIHAVRNSCVCAICERPNVHVFRLLGKRTYVLGDPFSFEACAHLISKNCFLRVYCILAVAAADVVVVVDVGIEFSMRADGTHTTHIASCA